ncbi:MAG: GNAT family N-acetyltransferase [Comamonadaceae bacterium]|nr:GNAT family N-acetyltransferase [Comamonadaceae bacterium]
MNIRKASSETEITACFTVFHELRPHLAEQTVVAQVQRQRRDHGWAIAYLQDGGQVVAAAGYRIAEYLAWGRTFYVDDVVTVSSARRKGYGGRLLDWLLQQARESGCDQSHLDSGVECVDAHRLHMSRELQVSSHHFSMDLK